MIGFGFIGRLKRRVYMRKALIPLVCSIALYGQGLVGWPDVLIMPEQSPRRDSAKAVTVQSNQTVYLKSVTSENRAALLKDDSLWALRQEVSSIEERDDWLGARSYRSDLHGRADYKGVPFIRSVGLEWAPTLHYEQRQKDVLFQGLADIGPRLEVAPYAIPVQLRGGVSALVWDDHVPTFEDIRYKQWYDTLGAYGGVEIGRMEGGIAGLPLLAYGSFYGRAVEGASQTTGLGMALYRTELSKGDSVFIYVADTMTNGNNAFISSGFSGGGGYVNTPRILDNSLRAVIGLKGVERLGIEPMLFYRFLHSYLKYPDSLALLNDAVNSRHAAGLLGRGVIWGADYEGGIAMEFERDDKLPGLTISSGRDTFAVDVRDFEGFRPEMRHSIRRYWKNSLGFSYNYSISRYLREYPREYAYRGDTIQSEDDYDEALQTHRLEASVLPLERVTLRLIGEYARNLRFRLKASRSADSYIDRSYELGAVATLRPGDNLFLEERVAVQADIMEYKYKLFNGNYPPYSRTFASEAALRWRLSDVWRVFGQWSYSKWDNGYWDAPAYRDTTLDSLQRESYYAIQRKSTDQKINLMTEINPNDNLFIRGGIEFRDVYFLEFRNGAYITNDLGSGYVAAPFAEIDAAINNLGAGPRTNRIALRGRIRRVMDTIASDFWDMYISLEAWF